MKLTEINQVPRGAAYDGGEEVETPGFGRYYIHMYTKGTRRYYELHGWYVGKSIFSSSILERGHAIELIKEIAEARIDRYRNQ